MLSGRCARCNQQPLRCVAVPCSILLVDNQKLSSVSSSTPCLKVYSKKDDGWQQRNEEALSLREPARTAAALSKMLAEIVHESIADFEEHLEDIGSKDWLNPGVVS